MRIQQPLVLVRVMLGWVLLVILVGLGIIRYGTWMESTAHTVVKSNSPTSPKLPKPVAKPLLNY